MKAMLLAAGRGERMRPLTDHTPKPLLIVGGKPLIAWHLEALARARVTEVIVNLSWLGRRSGRRWVMAASSGSRSTTARKAARHWKPAGVFSRRCRCWDRRPSWWSTAIPLRISTWARCGCPPGPMHAWCWCPIRPSTPGATLAWTGRPSLDRDPRPFTYSGIGIFSPALFAGCTAGRFPLLPLFKRAIAAGRLQGQRHDRPVA